MSDLSETSPPITRGTGPCGRAVKVMTILGTRPEIIRLCCVIQRLDEHLDHVLVHTGQNYDYELNEVFFQDLGLRKPDHFLGVDPSTLGSVLGGVLIESERVLREERPDAVLILGDTNSSLAGIMARRMKIPLFHMEAGNRSFDWNVPEEINRRIIDHIADFNLVYTEHARRHLLSEGYPHRQIFVTGSPMREVLDAHREAIEASTILEAEGLSLGEYFLASLHREENVDPPHHLSKLLDCLIGVHQRFELPVLVSTHPRTRKRLEALSRSELPAGLRFHKPFGFLDYVKLQQHARCVISDSGTISEESAILGFPAVSPRYSMERPEALDAGIVILTGLEPEVVLAAVEMQVSSHGQGREITVPAEYLVSDTSHRVVRLILGATGLAHRWQGVAPGSP